MRLEICEVRQIRLPEKMLYKTGYYRNFYIFIINAFGSGFGVSLLGRFFK
jgi:hypothetical protein